MEYAELEDRLDNRGYTNWIKAGLCLRTLKTALAPYTDKEMKRFHGERLKLNPRLRLRCQKGCSLKSKNWSQVIRHHHRQPDVTTVNWENCSPARWSQDHWELAKAYMPRGLFRVTSFDKCDASALLNLLNFCNWFSSVIHCRNELMHSCDMSMDDDWMEGFRQVLENLLVQLRLIRAQQQIHRGRGRAPFFSAEEALFAVPLCGAQCCTVSDAMVRLMALHGLTRGRKPTADGPASNMLGSDQMDAAVDEGLFNMAAAHDGWYATPATISELEAELLGERLQGLLQDTETQVGAT
ncbi:hypothetical protein NHX12_004487 [Muraenolepis orangiensis]|uniref:Uncharacterized protein n=1 Tax=Muraenolepis orangiensis TaxID=630683 RepID=A0A9Q0IEN5_9TELE|nr:hypothetical protein NHX12_004487 [Muraenolepis orangiensis]